MAREQRRLAAIVSADVVGYSRLMGRDDSSTLASLKAHRRDLIDPKIAEHGGRIVKTMGDGLLLEFPSVVDAVRCAVEVQRGMAVRNVAVPRDQRIEFRIGVNVGDIIIDDNDIFGDGVNIAARLQTLAHEGGICISATAREQIRDEFGASFKDIGEQVLKNIARPVRAFSMTFPSDASTLAGFGTATPVRGFGGRPAIAVLPFDNLSNDPEQAYFADGVAEDILTRLSMWRWMPVIARNSSFAYRGKAVELKQVGRALGARYILEGSVRRASERVRVSAQLIDAETDHHIWAQRYDRVLADIFALQDEITDAIVAALEPAVGRAERDRVRQKGTENLGAWDLYQRGAWHLGQYNRASIREARKFFLAAAESDTQFSTPLALAAFTRWDESMAGWCDPSEGMEECYRLAVAARSRDPLDPVALTVLGAACTLSSRYDEAIADCRKAIEINPSSSWGHVTLAYALVLNGQGAEALAEAETAIRLSPNDLVLPRFLTTLSLCHYVNRDYDKALQVSLRVVQLAPEHPLTYRAIARALGQLGRIEEGKRAVARMIELSPDLTVKMLRQTANFRDEAEFEHLVEGLRKAGWRG